jgi:hypothetical protein
MNDALNNLAYTDTKEFYKNLNSQNIDRDALEINDMLDELDDEIQHIEDAIYTK